jgi:hypothetical protein
MSARVIDYGLHIDCGGRFREPTADYRCPCGFEDAASGATAVAAFANTITRIHRAKCPNQQEG